MMDDNFSMALHHFTQLYAIRVPLGETSIPVAFAFLTDKTQSTYEELFTVLVNQCSNINLRCDPNTAIMDFESAAINAVQVVFGNGIHFQRCFYHLTQSTWRKVQELGLTELYTNDVNFKNACGMLDELAFLPTGDVVAGMQLLRRIAPPEATDLINYFDSTCKWSIQAADEKWAQCHPKYTRKISC